MGWLENLYDALDKRVMPETAARLILDGDGQNFTADELVLLRRAMGARPPWRASSMPEDFERPADCRDQLAAAARMFGVDADGWDPADPAQMRVFVDVAGERLGGWRHDSDWKRDRLPKERRAVLVGEAKLQAKRQYNRHVRVLRNLADKATRTGHAGAARRLILIGRSGFACDIPFERFAADPAAACFIVYYTARKNRRRLFSLSGKENPVDRLAAALLARCERNEQTDWEMIAWVCPQPQILARLTGEQRGALMGRWWAVMRDTAQELRAAWPDGVNKLSMIVQRGMDSSTWNTMAQAYNAARAGWINCASASGADAMVEPFCPGKVMRLMAADLAWWHQSSGGDVDPDTKVWAALPMPWDVIAGAARCARADVEAACRDMGVSPVARGWTAPRAQGQIAEFTPTPELVHGVEIADPAWAALLRRAGVFSGKRGAADAGELKDAAFAHGVVTGSLPVADESGTYAGNT